MARKAKRLTKTVRGDLPAGGTGTEQVYFPREIGADVGNELFQCLSIPVDGRQNFIMQVWGAIRSHAFYREQQLHPVNLEEVEGIGIASRSLHRLLQSPETRRDFRHFTAQLGVDADDLARSLSKFDVSFTPYQKYVSEKPYLGPAGRPPRGRGRRRGPANRQLYAFVFYLAAIVVSNGGPEPSCDKNHPEASTLIRAMEILHQYVPWLYEKAKLDGQAATLRKSVVSARRIIKSEK